jgi:hypothetical protein
MRTRVGISAVKNTQNHSYHPSSVEPKMSNRSAIISLAARVAISVVQQTQTFRDEPLIRVSAATVRIGSAERGERHKKHNNEIRVLWQCFVTNAFQNIVPGAPHKLLSCSPPLFQEREAMGGNRWIRTRPRGTQIEAAPRAPAPPGPWTIPLRWGGSVVNCEKAVSREEQCDEASLIR